MTSDSVEESRRSPGHSDSWLLPFDFIIIVSYIQIYKDTQNYNFACFVRVRNMVAHVEGGKYAEGV